jgi:general secretion pathway protein D
VFATPRLRTIVVAALIAGIAVAQQPPPRFQFPIPGNQPAQPVNPPAQPPAAPRPTTPAAPATATPQPSTTAAPGQAPTSTAPAQPPAAGPTTYGGLSLNNASLTEVIDLLARQLKLNYILDPRVKGGVILNTYGETKNIDTRSLLETILRINGFGMVKQGDLYRIVPLAEISHHPISPERKTDSGTIPEDDQTMLNLVFLKFVTSAELAKVLTPFIGENAQVFEYAPANLLLLLDSHRNMRRLMDLVAMFDSDQLAQQRVHVYEVKNGRPTDLAKELDGIVKSISFSEKNAPIRFIPIDRINTIIAVAPNPGVFAEVQKWIDKLDVPVKMAAGAINNYVYRVRYGDAQSIGCSIQALYGQLNGYGGGGSVASCVGANGGIPGAAGATGNPYGSGFNGPGYNGSYGNGYPGAYGANQYPPNGYPGGGYPGAQPVTATGLAPGAVAAVGTDLTGSYLGNSQFGSSAHVPRVVPNPFNNTLLIQAAPQEYENILQLLKDLDVPPRQVLIEAKIYSVDLSHGFSTGVAAKLQAISGTGASPHTFIGDLTNAITNLSVGSLVGKSRELLLAVQLQEADSKAKILSAPSVVATDSIPATITVGEDVPTLTAQAVTGAQQSGSSLFANSVGNRSTGVTLAIVARVTPSGVVTLVINQDVSAPQQTTSSSIQSPSFSKKSIQTQITVQDGDTIAIGGIIDETNTLINNGIPGLNRIPILGGAFGTRSYTKTRSELIIFITPRVIYDSTQFADASDDLKNRLKVLKKDIKE